MMIHSFQNSEDDSRCLFFDFGFFAEPFNTLLRPAPRDALLFFCSPVRLSWSDFLLFCSRMYVWYRMVPISSVVIYYHDDTENKTQQPTQISHITIVTSYEQLLQYHTIPPEVSPASCKRDISPRNF